MNKSLLVALAIMPTLLVGCKKDTKLQAIAFDVLQLKFSDPTRSKEIELDPKPTSVKIKFSGIKWTATVNDEDYSEKLEDYMGFKDTGRSAQVEGGILIEFRPGGKFKTLGENILKITATYKDKAASLDVSYSPDPTL